MQNWLISADEKKYDHECIFDKYSFIDWEQHNFKYEINDIVYIYSKLPIARIKYKTKVVKVNMSWDECPYREESKDTEDMPLVRFKLLQKSDSEELSFKNLENVGLKNPPQGAMKLNDDLVNYIEKYFDDDSINMWMVRAGEEAFLYDEFKNRELAVIGWGIEDVKNLCRSEIEELLKKEYPNKDKKTITDWAQMIYYFKSSIENEDYVLSSSPKSFRKYLLGKFTSDYYFSEQLIEEGVDTKQKYNNFRNVKWLCEFPWEVVSEEKRKFFQRKTLFKINDDIKEEILNYYWNSKKRNVIYFGAPGTGKSFNLNKDKYELLVNSLFDYERVTFHPDYSYANFVGTYKPRPKKDENGNKTDDITYEYVPGPFMRTLVKALKNPNKPFLLIIEEINRANVAAVFGDVFQLLDRDENNESEYPIDASEDMKDYLEEKLGKVCEKIKIPSNMFIWATMNSADQGVFPMDTAFKRRWNFKYFGINDEEDIIKGIKLNIKGKEVSWNKLRKAINEELLSYRINEDKFLGPFFAFTECLNNDISEEELDEIFKNKIIMYLFEDAARSNRNKLFSGAKENENENLSYSKIIYEFDENGIGIFCENIRDKLLSKETEESIEDYSDLNVDNDE